MSRIWQALKRAERERGDLLQEPAEIEDNERAAKLEDDGHRPVKSSDRRKGLRHSHCATLLVYGSDAEKQPFHEESDTVDANENGCLLSLTSDVARGQRLFLTNMNNQAEQECRVVYVGRRNKGRARVGVEFLQPSPQFWRPSR